MRLLGQQLLSVFTLFIFISLTPNVATAMDVKGMMSYKVVGKSIPKSLTGKPGDPKKGLKTAVNRKKGNCLACHTLPNVKQADHGEIGPPLTHLSRQSIVIVSKRVEQIAQFA